MYFVVCGKEFPQQAASNLFTIKFDTLTELPRKTELWWHITIFVQNNFYSVWTAMFSYGTEAMMHMYVVIIVIQCFGFSQHTSIICLHFETI